MTGTTVRAFRPRNTKAIAGAALMVVLGGLAAIYGYSHLSAGGPNNSLPARGLIGGSGVALGALALIVFLARGAAREQIVVDGEGVRYVSREQPQITCRRADIAKMEVVSDLELAPHKTDAWHLRFVDASGQQLCEVRFANRYGAKAVRSMASMLGNIPLSVQPPLWT